MTIEANTETTATENSAETPTSETPAVGSSSSTTTSPTPDGEGAIDLGATEAAKPEGETAEGEAKTGEVETPDENFGVPADDVSYEIAGLPEGMTIDKEALDAITPVARELGLSSVGLSKVAQVYAEKVLPQVQQAAIDNLQNSIVTTRAAWETEARDVIAGKTELKNSMGEPIQFDGNNQAHVMQVAAKALDKIGPAGFREFLSETGIGVHPMMVAFAYQAGKLLSEDTSFEGNGTTTRELSRTEKFYGEGYGKAKA